MLDIKRKISPYNHYEGNNVEYIVIHYTGNINDTAKNNADYFYGANRNASAHYFVDDNDIYQVVEEYNSAWHCGDGHNRYGINNKNSIAIEMCGTDNGRISEKTIENTLELTKYLMNKYGIDADHVVRHYDASRKDCPSVFHDNNWYRWWNFKERLSNKSSQTNQSDYRNGDYNCKAKVIVGVLNVRDSRPQNGSLGNIIGRLKQDQIIEVGYCLKGWFGVVLNNKQGFLNGKYIELINNRLIDYSWDNGSYLGRKAKVIADILNVRWDRGTEYNIIGQVKYGDIVNLHYCLNGWTSIEGFKGNKELGYINTKYLELI